MLTKKEIKIAKKAAKLITSSYCELALGLRRHTYSCAALADAEGKFFHNSDLVKKYSKFYGQWNYTANEVIRFWPDLGIACTADSKKALQRQLMLLLFAETKGEL